MRLKIILCCVFLFVLIGPAFAADTAITLLSAETGTATGSAKTVNKAWSSIAVDVITLGTGTVVVRVDGNASADGVFDSAGLGTAITCGSLKCTQVYTGQPMIQYRGVITSATGTNSTTVNIVGVP